MDCSGAVLQHLGRDVGGKVFGWLLYHDVSCPI